MSIKHCRIDLGKPDDADILTMKYGEIEYPLWSNHSTILDLYELNDWDDDPYKHLTPYSTRLDESDGEPDRFTAGSKIYYLGLNSDSSEVSIAMVMLHK